MTTPASPETSSELYFALGRLAREGGGEQALLTVLFKLLMEVEALRGALSDPAVPQIIRDRYREAYARTAILSHNAAGPTGGAAKVLAHFFPEERGDWFKSELAMLGRLGLSAEEQQEVRREMEEVQMYT